MKFLPIWDTSKFSTERALYTTHSREIIGMHGRADIKVSCHHLRHHYGYSAIKPGFCSSHLLRIEKPCCNFAFRYDFLCLVTIPTAKTGFNVDSIIEIEIIENYLSVYPLLNNF